MANSARERSTCAAGALSERLRRVSSWRSSAVSGRRGSFRWRDMGHLGARGSPHHHTRSHGKRPTRCYGADGGEMSPSSLEATPMERPMPQQLDDLSRSLTPLEQDSTIIAVIEMSQASWLVAGIVSGLERHPLKKLEPSEVDL